MLKITNNWFINVDFFRPPPLTSYHHLLDPASRPLLLAGLYGASSLGLPPPIPPPPTAISEERRSSGGPLDLSNLNATSSSISSENGGNGGNSASNVASVAGGKINTATSMHSFLGLHKSAGNNFT